MISPRTYASREYELGDLVCRDFQPKNSSKPSYPQKGIIVHRVTGLDGTFRSFGVLWVYEEEGCCAVTTINPILLNKIQ